MSYILLIFGGMIERK